MAKRQPFDTNLSFPPAPTRALTSTPLDGIIGGPMPRPEPPPHEAESPIQTATPATVDSTLAPAVIDTPRPSVVAAEPESQPPVPALPPAVEPANVIRRDVTTSVEHPEPADDGKVTVKLPPDLKNRLYNAIYAERGTVGDYLTRAVDDLMDQLERERGGPYPQRPTADIKFRAGRRPR